MHIRTASFCDFVVMKNVKIVFLAYLKPILLNVLVEIDIF